MFKSSGLGLFAVAVHHERAAECEGDEERGDRSRERLTLLGRIVNDRGRGDADKEESAVIIACPTPTNVNKFPLIVATFSSLLVYETGKPDDATAVSSTDSSLILKSNA